MFASSSAPLSRRFFFPSHAKLSSSTYAEVFSRGLRYATPGFLFIYLRTDEANAQLGLVMSKKKVRTSVRRARCKRLSREYFRLNFAQIPGLKLVVLANAKANTASVPELHQCFIQFWKKLSV